MIIKIILVILVLIIIAMIASVKYLGSFMVANNKEYTGNEEVIEASGKKTLIIYQPSKKHTTVSMMGEVVEALSAYNYSIVINNPSDSLTYDPNEYDVLIFSSAVYMGQTSQLLQRYMKSLDYSGKEVLIISVGKVVESPELAPLAALVPQGNTVHTFKALNNKEDKLREFISNTLSE